MGLHSHWKEIKNNKVFKERVKQCKNLSHMRSKIIRTQRAWIFYAALLTSIFLNTNEERSAAAERHWIMNGTAKLKQPIYCRDGSASEWNLRNVLC